MQVFNTLVKNSISSSEFNIYLSFVIQIIYKYTKEVKPKNNKTNGFTHGLIRCIIYPMIEMELNCISMHNLADALLRELSSNNLQPVTWKAVFSNDTVMLDVSQENKNGTIAFLEEKYGFKLEHTAEYKAFDVCTYTLTFAVPSYAEFATLLRLYGWKL